MLTTTVPMVLAAALLPSSVVAQEKSLKDQLVGTWIFVSAQDVKPDGTKVDPWGPNPKGAAMYDAKGRFTFMIMRSDLPKFASNNRAQATAEEGKAVAQGMIAFYGTYTVKDGVLTTRIEGSSYPPPDSGAGLSADGAVTLINMPHTCTVAVQHVRIGAAASLCGVGERREPLAWWGPAARLSSSRG
jgi:hypothetical protein